MEIPKVLPHVKLLNANIAQSGGSAGVSNREL
jgi:hypothetical protein